MNKANPSHLRPLTIRGWLLLGLFASLSFAKEPKVTHLFPAGAQRGATAKVTCHGDFDWPLSVWASAGKIQVHPEKGELSIEVPEDVAADRIWLRFYNKDGATSPIPFLLGNLPEATETEPNDSPTSAQQLGEVAKPPNDARLTINGVLNKKGDVDCFRVKMRAGQTLVAVLAGNSQFGSPLDAILQVASEDGIVLAENHDAVGLDPRLVFQCRQKGQYVIRVFAFPATPNQSIQFHGGSDYVYRLTLTTGPYVSHTIPSIARTMQFGVVTPAAVTPVGWNIPPHTKLPVLRSNYRYAPTFTEHSHARVRFVHAPGWAGTCSIPMGTHRVLEADFFAAQKGVAECPLGSTVDGQLPIGQTATYQLQLAKGEKTSISVESVSLHSPMVPKVKITSPSGKVVYRSPESGPDKDVLQSISPSETGVYVLAIQDRYGAGGEHHVYRLTASPAQDDFAVQLAKDSFTIADNGEVEVPITITRTTNKEGIGDIYVEATQLPPGVTCTPAISKREGDSAQKVTLKLQSKDADSFSGPIRIRATAIDGQLRRTALTPSFFGYRLDAIWLTVTDNKSE